MDKTRITPAFIPHDRFHKGVWLQSVKRPGWYYFLEKENDNVITNGDFAESVDPPLRELVRFLHGRGIRTTPSCAGHHKSEGNFETIFDQLEQDKADIRNGGLELKDVESGDRFVYREKNYSLPWSRKTFIDRILDYQSNGVIGIRAGEREKEQLLQIRLPGVRVEEIDSIVFIFTEEDPRESIAEKWSRITLTVKSVFSGSAARVRVNRAYRAASTSRRSPQRSAGRRKSTTRK
jgi:hypothetical protein